MTFFKDNKKYILKLVLTHLVMTIFGMMVYLPFKRDDMSMRAFLIVGSAVAVLLYLFLIDVDMWYLGAEDKLRVDAGRQKRNAGKGFIIALIAEIPAIVIGILFVLSYYLLDYFSAYEASPGYTLFYGVMIVVNLIWNGMYHGISVGIFDKWVPWFYFAIPLLPIAFSGLTYWLGLINSPVLKPPARNKKQN